MIQVILFVDIEAIATCGTQCKRADKTWEGGVAFECDFEELQFTSCFIAVAPGFFPDEDIGEDMRARNGGKFLRDEGTLS
jgi:hypothetical protein